MPRIAVVLFLLCFAWSQAFAAECPAFPDAPGSGTAHEETVSAHGGHAAHSPGGEEAPAHSEDRPHHADGVCPMASGCGIAAAPATTVPAPLPDLSRAAAFVAPADPLASPYIGSDPPPPRPY